MTNLFYIAVITLPGIKILCPGLQYVWKTDGEVSQGYYGICPDHGKSRALKHRKHETDVFFTRRWADKGNHRIRHYGNPLMGQSSSNLRAPLIRIKHIFLLWLQHHFRKYLNCYKEKKKIVYIHLAPYLIQWITILKLRILTFILGWWRSKLHSKTLTEASKEKKTGRSHLISYGGNQQLLFLHFCLILDCNVYTVY